jgi:hypothetical protein
MRMTRKVLIAAVALSVVALIAIAAQERTSTTLTPQDYLDIQQLVARYPYTLDGGLGTGKAYADLFSDDGEFHQQTGRVWRGRKELLTIADKGEETPDALGHFAMNHTIEATPQGAAGKQYLLTISPLGEPTNSRQAWSVTPYRYDDIYVKTPAGWRFKSRTVVERPPVTGGRGAQRPN